jgi:hypothetical protein
MSERHITKQNPMKGFKGSREQTTKEKGENKTILFSPVNFPIQRISVHHSGFSVHFSGGLGSLALSISFSTG